MNYLNINNFKILTDFKILNILKYKNYIFNFYNI